MKRYIKASADISDSISKLQNASNDVVDAILSLMDEVYMIQQSIDRYDAENAEYYTSPDEKLEAQFKNDIGNITWELGTIKDDIDRLMETYIIYR